MKKIHTMPKARTDGLVFTDLDDERLVYDSENNRAATLRPLAACVLRYCDGVTSFPDAVRMIESEMGLKLTDETVAVVLADLRDHLLIVGELPTQSPEFSRRTLIRKGIVAGIAGSAIIGISLPTAANAASGCIAGGQQSSGAFPGLNNSQTCVSNLLAQCCTGQATGGGCSCDQNGDCSGSVICAGNG